MRLLPAFILTAFLLHFALFVLWNQFSPTWIGQHTALAYLCVWVPTLAIMVGGVRYFMPHFMAD